MMATEVDFTKLQMSTSTMNDWFSESTSGDVLNSFLNNPDELTLDFNGIESPTDSLTYFTPEQAFTTGSDNSAYSSDSSDTSSPFDQFSTDNTHSGISSPVDDNLFESYNITDPSLVPEIEKILATNYEMEFNTPATPAPETSSKKRQRETESKAPVTLPRDQLLSMTSKEIEDYVSGLKTKRKLTSEEERELKKQRRLVKNREYASQSRSRKKQFVDELEKQLEDARAETAEAKKQNQALIEENRILKRQLGCIAETIKKSQLQAGQATDKDAKPSTGAVGLLEKFVKVGSSKTRNVSACLLAIFFMVFTFAAFWENERSGMDSSANSFTFSTRTLSSVDLDYEPGVWEAASVLIRQTWDSAASSLPDWDSAYSLFVSTYPVFFSSSASTSSISSSSSSSSSSDVLPISKSTEQLLPCTEQAKLTLLQPTNETKRCATNHGSAV